MFYLQRKWVIRLEVYWAETHFDKVFGVLWVFNGILERKII